MDLREIGRWRVGGRARVVVEPADGEDVRRVLALLHERGLTTVVVGGGSNILFDDAGFHGVVVLIGASLARVEIEGTTARVEAGAWVPLVARRLGRAGLSGLEHTVGIPGTFGGLVIMNGGSQRKGVGSSIVSVWGCDLAGHPFERDGAACAFRYRGSTLQDDDLVVLGAELRLTPGDPAAIRHEMIAIMADRRRKFPKNLPNCGSVFLSDPAMYATVGPPGAAIERVGLKGRSLGGAQISPMHANFIVNNGGASTADILGLVDLARRTVADETGFELNCEVRHLAPDGTVRPAHEVARARAGRS